MAKKIRKQDAKTHEPNIAPSMEMDELEEKASEKEIREGESTSVTNLYMDRI